MTMKKLLYLGPSGIGDWCFIYPSLPSLLAENHADQVDLILPYRNDGNALLKKNTLINSLRYLHRETRGFKLFRYLLRYYRLLRAIRQQRYETVAISYLSNQPDMLLLAFLSGAKKRVAVRTNDNLLQKVVINHPVNAKGAENRVAMHQRYAPQPSPSMTLPPLVPIERQSHQALLKKHQIQAPYIVLGIGGGRNADWRFWPAKKFAALIKLNSAYQWILMGGGDDDLQQAQQIMMQSQGEKVTNLVNQTSMEEACMLIADAQAVIGNDSGIANLSALMKVPTLCLYGPTSSKLTGPTLNGATPVQIKLPCQPCFGEPNNPSIAIQCTHRNCLALLTSKQVHGALHNLLKTPSSRCL